MCGPQPRTSRLVVRGAWPLGAMEHLQAAVAAGEAFFAVRARLQNCAGCSRANP